MNRQIKEYIESKDEETFKLGIELLTSQPVITTEDDRELWKIIEGKRAYYYLGILIHYYDSSPTGIYTRKEQQQ